MNVAIFLATLGGVIMGLLIGSSSVLWRARVQRRLPKQWDLGDYLWCARNIALAETLYGLLVYVVLTALKVAHA